MSEPKPHVNAQHSTKARRPTLRHLAATLTSVLAALALIPTAAAQPGTEFVQVVGTISRDLAGEPGQTINQSVRVKNTGGAAAYVTIHFEDVELTATGLEAVGEQSAGRSNRAWFAGPPEPVLVQPGAIVDVPFSITIPAEAAGGYWSSVIVRPESFVRQTLNFGDRTRVPVEIVTQYAGLVFTNVNNTGSNALTFSDIALGTSEAGHVAELTIRNDGDRADVFDLRAQLMNDLGVQVYGHTLRTRLVGGYERTVAFPLGQLPPGEYTLIVIADAGQLDVFARQFRVVVP